MQADPRRARERLLWTSVSGTILGLLLLVLIVLSRSLDEVQEAEEPSARPETTRLEPGTGTAPRWRAVGAP